MSGCLWASGYLHPACLLLGLVQKEEHKCLSGRCVWPRDAAHKIPWQGGISNYFGMQIDYYAYLPLWCCQIDDWICVTVCETVHEVQHKSDFRQRRLLSTIIIFLFVFGIQEKYTVLSYGQLHNTLLNHYNANILTSSNKQHLLNSRLFMLLNKYNVSLTVIETADWAIPGAALWPPDQQVSHSLLPHYSLPPVGDSSQIPIDLSAVLR